MNRNQAVLSVAVALPDGDRYAANIVINGPVEEAFRPVDRCDNLRDQLLFGTDAQTMRMILRTRPQFAKELAEILAKQIMATMEAKDRTNGYTKEELES